MGKHLGTARSQSRVGDLLGDVRNFGVITESAGGRGYQSNQRLNFHTDSCDVTGLFVLHVAKEGGLSKLASSVAVRNEIARRRPDLLEVLYQPFYWSWNKQEPADAKPYYAPADFQRGAGLFLLPLYRRADQERSGLPGGAALYRGADRGAGDDR